MTQSPLRDIRESPCPTSFEGARMSVEGGPFDR